MGEYIFGREEERQCIRQRLSKQKPFLIHGPSGVGKTLLVRSTLKELPNVLYSDNSVTTQTVFRNLAHELLRTGNTRVRAMFRDPKAIEGKSTVALKGIVLDALRGGKYAIVLDHIKCPSHSLAAAVREILGWASSPVSAVARSSHMEDVGFLQPFYSDRSERYEVRNFDSSEAEQFARETIGRTALYAPNLSDFVSRLLEFSGGNPGAIVSLIRMAKFPKYRSGEHIMITPLYIDFRMNRSAPR